MKSYQSIFRKAMGFIPLSVAVALYSCNSADKSQTEIVQDTDVLVKVQMVSRQPVEQLSELTGNIEAYRVNNIVTTIPGRIDNILADVGDRVRRGQVLVQMDRTNLVQAQLQLDNAEKELGRVEELFIMGSATQQQLEQLTSQVEQLRETVRNLAENTELTSPIDGIVSDRSMDPKNVFSGGQAILTVMQIAPVKVLIDIPEVHFPQIKSGMEVRVRLEVYPDREFTGKINAIHPTIDQLSRTFSAEVTIANADLAIRPGMFARVEISFGTTDNVVVPDVAVIRQQGTNTRYVFTVENGIAYRREIQIGRLMGDAFEVISGVEPGALVVIAGQSKLLDKTPVRIENSIALNN